MFKTLKNVFLWLDFNQFLKKHSHRLILYHVTVIVDREMTPVNIFSDKILLQILFKSKILTSQGFHYSSYCFRHVNNSQHEIYLDIKWQSVYFFFRSHCLPFFYYISGFCRFFGINQILLFFLARYLFFAVFLPFLFYILVCAVFLFAVFL